MWETSFAGVCVFCAYITCLRASNRWQISVLGSLWCLCSSVSDHQCAHVLLGGGHTGNWTWCSHERMVHVCVRVGNSGSISECVHSVDTCVEQHWMHRAVCIICM